LGYKAKYNWIIEGVLWGLFMFIIMGLLYPYHQGEALGYITLSISFLKWMAAGLVYGWVQRLIRRKFDYKVEDVKS